MEILLSKRLSGLMAEENLTGKQLAAKTKITEGTISKILTGVNTNPKSDTIITLAKYFNVSSDYLLGLSEYKTPQAADIGAITGLTDKNIDLFKDIAKHDKAKILEYQKKANRSIEMAEYLFNNFYHEPNMRVFNDVIYGIHYNWLIDKICELRTEVNLSKAFINDVLAGNPPAWDFEHWQPVDDYAYAFIAKDRITNYLTELQTIFIDFLKEYIGYEDIEKLYNTLIDKWRKIHPAEIPVGTPEKPFDKISSFIREKEGDT